ncbi:CD63 antigen [Anastrepha obliqua]|uniref:CD63 antigen n=1 Tax=Anastrepha obliqua TaxID=95512 RepID=UPI00240949B4|nr:CD63 antigen [Anastrepha obliqua]
MARDQLNSSMRCAKFMLIIVSFMFALTAILLVMVGTTIQAIFGDFNQFLDAHFSSPPALLIAIGFILLLVAALGAYGAVKESVMLINLYGFCLFLVFILEVAAAIAAFVMQTQVREMLVRTMNESIQAYDDNVYVQDGVDFMQGTLGCCGVNSPVDWKRQNDSSVDNNIELPSSCCAEFSFDDINYCVQPYESGCLSRMDFIISQSTMLIATGATTVAFVQILGVLCAFMLAKTLRRNKSIRAARRWQLQQSLGVLISGGKVAPPTNSPINGYTQLERAERYMEQDPITYTPSSPSVN